MHKYLEKAIDSLSSLFEFDALQASTDPVEFLNMVADEIKLLRQSSDDEKRIDGENRLAAVNACRVLRIVARYSRRDAVLPRSVLMEVIDSAQELSRCGFENEELVDE